MAPRPRKKKRRAAAAPAATLPDDVVLEILVRVADDVAALFRCAVTCKPWRALVADPSFLRRRWPEGVRHPSSFLGLFGRPWLCYTEPLNGPPVFAPSPRSPLDPARRFPGSFGPCIGGSLNKAVPLASRQGLLLVCLIPPGNALHSSPSLAVVDMFAGTCDVLPGMMGGCASLGISFASLGISGYAILTDADFHYRRRQSPSSSYSAFFKVLVITHDSSDHAMYTQSNKDYNLYTFSSDQSRWSTLPMECIHLQEHMSIESAAVVCRGKVHWLLWNSLSLYTLEFSNETGHISLTKLPVPRGKHEPRYENSARLSVTIDGNLSLLCLCWKSLELMIWTRGGMEGSGDGIAYWVRTKIIMLKPEKPLKERHGSVDWLHRLSCKRVAERSGTLFIAGDRRLEFIVNIDTGEITEIPTEFSVFGKHNAVPFEIDWPAFFASRLEEKQKE